ncbi:hypothetical protein L6452_21608 [Arctium lappa]|uniref:Uncharacterized protein n=1 Tax=Arctium lappa TaxID=4217 RepID=A0ACB9AXI4_ARCLA|nr:hypothetical protein L6452_21608 [Arctium lappa]
MSIEAPNLYIFPMLYFIQVSHYAIAFITIVYITQLTVLLFKLSTSLLESIKCDGSLFKSQMDQRPRESSYASLIRREKKQVKATKRIAIEESLDDGHVWTKYGQKMILGSKYPSVTLGQQSGKNQILYSLGILHKVRVRTQLAGNSDETKLLD